MLGKGTLGPTSTSHEQATEQPEEENVPSINDKAQTMSVLVHNHEASMPRVCKGCHHTRLHTQDLCLL